jgi:hypothetical protein
MLNRKIGLILEGLHDRSVAQVDEGTVRLFDNIDKDKFRELEKKLNKAGFTFTVFNLYKLAGGHFSRQIIIGRKNERDDLLPQITIGRDDKFYIHPSFMGDLSTSDAKKMADNLIKTVDLVNELNRINFESFMTKDAPSND